MQTFPCRLHQLNTLLGKIASFSKETIKKNMRIVCFFNRSHYWGGRLRKIAQQEGVTRGLTINTESCWYAFILMFLSVQAHK